MKTSASPAGKSKGNGSSPQPRASARSLSSSGSDDCPREQMIAEAAYFRAQQRGFEPGNEMSDWLQAEADVEAILGNIH